ncbi:nSTAND1 domain-containing NTPase [Thermocatellispora tengchongensis]|uniref:nSTAND1 domain-containing NTPase n=1 Tax=Thermocatellispora tengchongensis TaxID=1073253 RepID=UPI0036391EBE
MAEDAYALLSPAERELVPELLLRLVAIGPDGLETVRPAPVAELLPEHPEARRRILEVFGYMLAERDGEVRLARPALLRAWPRLRSWVEAERDGLPVLAGLSRAAREWEANGRRDADLLQGSRLEAARDWAAAGRRHLTLTPLERDYLAEAGRLVRRRSNRRRLLTMALAGLLALSLAGGGIAVHQAGQVAEQRDRVADERDKGRARELAGEVAGLRTVDPVKAMLLSVAAWRLNPGIEGRAALTGSLFQREVAAFRPPPAPGAAVNTTSGDGRLIAAVTERTVRVFDAATGRQVASWTAPELARGVASTDLSGTGRLLAVVAGESVAVYETRTGRLVGEEAIDDNPAVTVLEFGGSDTMLNITVAEASFGVWDLGRDRVERPRWGYPQRVVPGPTGDLVVTETDGEVSVWRLPGFRRDTRFPSGCGGEDPVIGFSPDGGAVFCAGERFELWDAGTGKRIRQAVEDDYDYGTYRWSWDGLDDDEPGGAPAGFRLSRDRGLAVAHRDAVIRVWDVERHERVLDYTARGRVSDAWFDPGGRILRYRIDDEVVAIDLAFPVRPRPAPPDANFVVLSGDARLLAYQPFEGEPRVELWDVAAGRVLGSVPAQENTVLEARFDPAARLLALSHVNETVDVYDVATRRRLWHFRHPHGLITTGEAFSPDGRTYAAVYSQNSQRQVDYWLHRFDARTGRQLGVAKLEAPMRKFAFLPDGRHIVSELGRQVDVTTGKTIGPGRTPAGSVTAAVAVDPTGRWLAVGKADGGVTLWQAADRTPVALDLPAIGREAGELVFSPKGDMLAMIDGRERLSLWDVATRRPIVTGVVFGRIGDGRSWEVAFTPDGRTLRVSNDTGTVWDLPVDPARAAQAVCARAGRTLTRAEWREHLGSIPYRDVCAGA